MSGDGVRPAVGLLHQVHAMSRSRIARDREVQAPLPFDGRGLCSGRDALEHQLQEYCRRYTLKNLPFTKRTNDDLYYSTGEKIPPKEIFF